MSIRGHKITDGKINIGLSHASTIYTPYVDPPPYAQIRVFRH
jgi:hypothetical protein